MGLLEEVIAEIKANTIRKEIEYVAHAHSHKATTVAPFAHCCCPLCPCGVVGVLAFASPTLLQR